MLGRARPAPHRVTVTSQGRRPTRAGTLTLVLLALSFVLALPLFAQTGPSGVVTHNAARDWSGTWRTYWPGGQAQLRLEQEGATVAGTYRPGNGRIAGTLDGPVLRGSWHQAGSEGSFEFAMAPDGQSFVGRFDGGDYWNGARTAPGSSFEPPFGSRSPEAALASALMAMNAAADGNGAAELTLRRFLVFAGNDNDLGRLNDRIAELSGLMRRTTLDLEAVPDPGVAEHLTVEIGPAGVDWTFPLTLRRGLTDLWDVEVPSADTLAAWEAAMLSAAGAADLDALDHARRASPRQAIQTFLAATANWREGGRDRALEVLDLSAIPEPLRAVDGTFAAEYLRQTIDRIGAPIWQEIPDNPDRRSAFTLYRNEGGQVELQRFDEDDGPVWRFSAATLAAAPAIFEALQNLPPAFGATPAEPLTRAFRLREALGDVSPLLLRRGAGLELWQWLALGASLPVAFGLSWLVALALRGITGAGLRLGRAGPETVAAIHAAFRWPVRWFLGGLVLFALTRELALPQTASVAANAVAGLISVSGATIFAYFVVDAIVGSLSRSAARTSTSIDDIATAIGGGVARIAVVVAGAILAAEVLGLPYEGVIAALGVGGLALGFAARDAVSNLISAGILMADRPFKKGDLIEAGGTVGVVEAVGLRSTRLRTLDDALLIVPNSKVSDEQVNNWGRLRARRVNLAFWGEHDTPRPAVDRWLAEVAEAFDAMPEARGKSVVVRDGVDAVGLVVRVIGFLKIPELDAYLAARDGLIAEIVERAGACRVRFAHGEESEPPTPSLISSVETRQTATPT